MYIKRHKLKKMKKEIFLSIFAVAFSIGTAFPQAANQEECIKNLNLYVDDVKKKDYDKAYDLWKWVYDNCDPKISPANYSYGERILKHKIENAEGVAQQGFINDLLALYDKSGVHFPKRFTKAGVIIDKVDLKYTYKMISDEEIFTQLDEAFKQDKANFKNPKALYLYFSSLVNLHEKGSKDLQLVFNVYDDVMEKIDVENKKLLKTIETLLPKDSANTITPQEKRRLKAYTTNSTSFGKIMPSIDAKLGKLADCENLIPLYERNFAANTTNLEWIQRAMSRMFAKECTDDPLFRKLLDAKVALEPSSDGFFYKGILEQKAGNSSAAIEAFNKAIEMETDRGRKAEILYKIATMMKRRGSNSSARSYANKALQQDRSMGKALLLISNLIAGSANECGSTTFEKKAVYWMAADYARRAARVDPSLGAIAAKTAQSYEGRAPSRTEIFNSGLSGQTIKFNCWVGGSVTVPKL